MMGNGNAMDIWDYQDWELRGPGETVAKVSLKEAKRFYTRILEEVGIVERAALSEKESFDHGGDIYLAEVAEETARSLAVLSEPVVVACMVRKVLFDRDCLQPVVDAIVACCTGWTREEIEAVLTKP